MRLITALLLLAASPLDAKVMSATPAGFEVAETVQIAAPPERVFAALSQIERWWNGTHSYSGNSANLSLDPRVGGCFCEKLPDGGVEHMRVVYARSGQTLRLQGGLGPLQAEGAIGSFTWSLKPAAGGTELTQSYIVGGYLRAGGDKLASPVDRVLAEQLDRLRRFVETGSATAAKTR